MLACYNLGVEKLWGIYIHIPFCERKCTYCNFNTTDFFEDLAEQYVRAVELEIESWRDDRVDPDAPRVADSIYFGGGTPSIVEPRQLARLIAACRRSFEVSKDV